MNEYNQILNILFSHHAAGKSDLSQVEKIAAYLGCPQNTFPAIHIAGSNGKGSVCTKIAKSLELAGYKVGLYTSHCKPCTFYYYLDFFRAYSSSRRYLRKNRPGKSRDLQKRDSTYSWPYSKSGLCFRGS